MIGEPETTFEIDQDKVGRAVHDLMSAAKGLSDLSEDQFLTTLIRQEYEDIELTHEHLGRMLQKLRGA